MEYIPYSKRETKQVSDDCTVHEQPSNDEIFGKATIELRGRHPESGWSVNLECHALLVVMARHGRYIPHPDTGKEAIEVSAGGDIHIPPNEKYALEGDMKIAYVTTPPWTDEQYRTVE